MCSQARFRLESLAIYKKIKAENTSIFWPLQHSSRGLLFWTGVWTVLSAIQPSAFQEPRELSLLWSNVLSVLNCTVIAHSYSTHWILCVGVWDSNFWGMSAFIHLLWSFFVCVCLSDYVVIAQRIKLCL